MTSKRISQNDVDGREAAFKSKYLQASDRAEVSKLKYFTLLPSIIGNSIIQYHLLKVKVPFQFHSFQEILYGRTAL